MLAAGLKASLEDVDDGGHDADDVYDDDEVLPPLLDDEVLLETAKARYDDILAKRSKKKAAGSGTPLTQREKAEAFVDLLKTENADNVFSRSGGKLFTDGSNVGAWWNSVTKVGGTIDRVNEVKAILMADPTAKARYDDIQAKRSKKKAAGPVTPLTQREKAEAFVDLLETENADDVFSYSGGNSFTDGVNVGTWWRNVTQVGGLIDEDNDVRVQLPCGYGKSQLAV